tara:strand:- start:179 stop:937 length:759 start_codon:yes stop_codon:yes gene_type:complete
MKNNLNIFYPTDESIIDFIKNHNTKYDKKLSNYHNFSRVVSLSDFHRLIHQMNLNNFSKVAVVSGSLEEPELKLIKYEHIDILDYEEVSGLFDLDVDWKIINNSNKANSKFYKEGEYNFVFCNQVFEHIFSPIQAIKNIHYITKKNGYAWISVPTINCIHGDPYFYSAGYHPRYLYRLCKESGFEVMHVGAFCSRKYLAHAVQGHWCSHDELKAGFRSKRDFAYPYFAIQDGRKNCTSGKFITDTWVLLKKS